MKKWEGIDASLDISAFEYGILYNTETKELIYGEGYNTDGEFETFKSYHVTDEYSSISEDNNIKESFFNFLDSTKENWLLKPVVEKYFDLIHYFGSTEILGSGFCRKEYTKKDIEEILNLK